IQHRLRHAYHRLDQLPFRLQLTDAAAQAMIVKPMQRHEATGWLLQLCVFDGRCLDGFVGESPANGCPRNVQQQRLLRGREVHQLSGSEAGLPGPPVTRRTVSISSIPTRRSMPKGLSKFSRVKEHPV